MSRLIKVRTDHASSDVFTQGKIYDVECKYDSDGIFRLAKVFNDQGLVHFINLIGPCAYLDGIGEWKVVRA
tara:strand:+ start:528 stop:740 length:213 start_codon:yes stop_codon:yes gene_type:complete